MAPLEPASTPPRARPEQEAQSDVLHAAETEAPLDMPTLRALVHGRDQERAIRQLTAAHRQHPENLEIRSLLAGLLRHRALVAYGRGWLDSAVDDWSMVVVLVPDDVTTATHLRVARGEMAQRVARAREKKNAGG
jgi:hypothetical protein